MGRKSTAIIRSRDDDAVKSFFNHPYTFWLILSLPAFPMIATLLGDDPRAVHGLLHPTGEFAARFMIIAMMITPLMMLFKGANWPRWMMQPVVIWASRHLATPWRIRSCIWLMKVALP